LAQRGQTSDPIIVNILRAKTINQCWGGPFISPMEVNDLPNDILDATDALMNGLPKMKQAQKTVDDYFARFERQMNYKHRSGK
jgi:hypothetical protein